MTQLGEAVTRYHKLIESEPYRDLSWAEELRNQMVKQNLTVGGRPVSAVLRPHFISSRQYASLVKAAEGLYAAIGRVKEMALANPVLLNKMEMLPAEKMLAAIDPKYPFLSVTSLLATHLNNGDLRFEDYTAETPMGVAYNEALSDLYYDCAPVRDLRKKFKLSKLAGPKPLLQALLKAYKEYGGRKKPQLAILEFRQPFQTADTQEYVLLRDYFRQQGFACEVVSPDQLEYRNGVLRRTDFEINLIYRRMKVHEFLVRFDLTHPLVRAYKEGAVCMVNSFRSEMAQKRAIFDLLTDEAVTGSFPAAEKRAIRDFIPWTRVVSATKTTFKNKTVDLLEFIIKHREKLVLKPNDDSGEDQSFRGWEVGEAGWERALKSAMRTPYVVQERLEPARAVFPIYQHGYLEFRELGIDVQPHVFLGKVHGCSSFLSMTTSSGFTSGIGLAPTFILEGK
jgi:hypothetical protein